MNVNGTVLALAAFALIESLILELRDREYLGEADLAGILDDVSNAHARAAEETDGKVAAYHREVTEVIEMFRQGGNSVRVVDGLLEKDPASAIRT